MLAGEVHELAECATCCILLEGLTLGKLLQHLESGGQFLVRVAIESKRGLEGARRDNFDASVLLNIFILNQLVDVNEWIRKLLLCRKISLHFFNRSDRVVDVFGLHN